MDKVTRESPLSERLEYSRLMAGQLERRALRCPNCGFLFEYVYGYKHEVVEVKCKKCRRVYLLDVALFRTQKDNRGKAIKLK